MSALQKNSPASARVATALFFILIIFGFVMLASAGIAEGQKKCGFSYCYLWHQIQFGLIPGLIIFYIFSKIHYEHWRKLALPILMLAVLLLVLVFIPGIGVAIKGAQRWVDLKIVTIQPSEFLKFALVVYLAAWFGSNKARRSASEYVPFFFVLAAVAFLLALQPDYGTLGIIILICLALYFFSGAKFKHLAILVLVVLVALGSMALAAPYRFNRIRTFLDPQSDPRGSAYHVNQAKIAIGSGGLFGVGYGQSKQKLTYLPEPIGDSIFAVTVEELGLAGGMGLMAVYLAFLLVLIRLSVHAPDLFGKLIVLGVAVWVGSQAFINIGSMSGLIPLAGVPLPLMSYGSSALVSLMGAMGIVHNIGRRS